MIKIKRIENFQEFDKLADKLLDEYDSKNDVNYNFKQFVFTASENDEIVGILTGFSYYAEVQINNLVVLEKYRGQGIGSKLIKQVENYFADKGFNNINLTTNAFQAPEFYTKCGFELEFVRNNKENPKLTKYFFVKYFCAEQ